MKSSAFNVAKKYFDSQAGASTEDVPKSQSDFIDGGEVKAVLIDSPIVGPVWFALSDDFESDDTLPVFCASELPHLREMSEAELKRRYSEKLALAGGWIRDRVDKPTRH